VKEKSPVKSYRSVQFTAGWICPLRHDRPAHPLRRDLLSTYSFVSSCFVISYLVIKNVDCLRDAVQLLDVRIPLFLLDSHKTKNSPLLLQRLAAFIRFPSKRNASGKRLVARNQARVNDHKKLTGNNHLIYLRLLPRSEIVLGHSNRVFTDFYTRDRIQSK
jgi:hypothetical protein